MGVQDGIFVDEDGLDLGVLLSVNLEIGREHYSKSAEYNTSLGQVVLTWKRLSV